MDGAIVSLAGKLQLVGLAVVLIMAILLGIRAFSSGRGGIAMLLTEIAGLLVGLWIVVRPNDAIGLLMTAIGGVQTPVLPH